MFGHFTQLVWKESKRVGCAINTRPCEPLAGPGLNFPKDILAVCYFDPPGNMVSAYKENVSPNNGTSSSQQPQLGA